MITSPTHILDRQPLGLMAALVAIVAAFGAFGASCGGVSVDGLGPDPDASADVAPSTELGAQDTPATDTSAGDNGAPDISTSDRIVTEVGTADVTTIDVPSSDGAPGFCRTNTDCASGQSCCTATGRCYPSGCLACCMVPVPTDGGIDGGSRICGSSTDCAASDECVFPEAMCARSGMCTPRIACLVAQPFCACTGETYASCRADRPTQSRGPCPTSVDAGRPDTGTSFCAMVLCAPDTVCCEATRACLPRGALCIAPPDAGTDATPLSCHADTDCAHGQSCCGVTGRCYVSGCLSCCISPMPPDAGPDISIGVDSIVIRDVPPSACITSTDCVASSECVYPDTVCARSGVCTPRIACLVAQPFCACTGTTYMACRADRPTQSRGPCPISVDAGRPDTGTSFCALVRCTSETYCCEAARACIPRGASCPTDPPPDAGTTSCGGGRGCAVGQSCCDLTGLCYPTGCLSCCMPRVDAGTDTGHRACSSASDCGSAEECLYPDTVCTHSGVCVGRILCTRPEVFCSCTGSTYLACRPDRPTQSRSACSIWIDAGIIDTGTSFCATVRCRTGTTCCETTRSCLPSGLLCPSEPPDAGPTACSVGLACPIGQSCCASTGLCYPSACLSCCMPRADAGLRGCATSIDCGHAEECVYPSNACDVRGTCQGRIECLIAQPFCSCTGVSYAACRPDRPTSATGACSATARCRSNRDCAVGTTCCLGSGVCYPSTCRDCCRFF